MYFSLGQPTTQEKAKLFIKSLDLGLAIPDISPIILPDTNLTRRHATFDEPDNLTQKKRALQNYCPSSVQKICKNINAGKESVIWPNLYGKWLAIV